MRFYDRPEWLALRYRVLRKYGFKCQACSASPRDDGAVLHVDHIRPISKFPELALEESNLQVLCADCNLGKSNRYEDDHRPDGGRPLVTPQQKPRRIMGFRNMDPDRRMGKIYVRYSQMIKAQLVRAEVRKDAEAQHYWLKKYLGIERDAAKIAREYYLE